MLVVAACTVLVPARASPLIDALTLPGGTACGSGPLQTVLVPSFFTSEVVLPFILTFYEEALGRTTTDPPPAGILPGVPKAGLPATVVVDELVAWASFLRATHYTTDAMRAMIHAFFDGAEFRDRSLTVHDTVTSFYRAILAREPDAAGLDGWIAFLYSRYNAIVPLFTGSAEFQAAVGDLRTPADASIFVTRLYQELLGRAPDGSGLAAWTSFLVATGDASTIVQLFAGSTEYRATARTLGQHVANLYRAILARSPGTSEQAAWVAVLALSAMTVEDAFVDSDDFQRRCRETIP